MSDKAVIVPYADPLDRTLGTLRRQLVLDALLVALGTLGSIPLDGPVNWRAITLGALALLLKTVITTAQKYDRALGEDLDAFHITMERDDED